VSRIDLKIIESIRSGRNDEALAYLYDKPLKKIRKHILSNNGSVDDANDIFQDSVIILFNQVKSNRYNTNYEVDGFLFVVARNLWVNKTKRDKKIVNNGLNLDSQQTDNVDHLKDLIGKEKSAAFRKVFEKLGENCQKILHYAIFEQLSMKEISEKMGFSNSNVAKSNHYRCKQYLTRIVQEDQEVLNLLRN
jgi:RNA polymerase sigma factor (sigma-70 family)